jgi:DNA-binding NarL/FixJ family response regulator
LIVDDSKLARMAVIRVLSTLHPNWQSTEAANAEQALEALKREAPDFVLLDFNMPGKDGLALAEELRSLDPRLRVAVISANHQVEVVNRAQASGATFLRKPLTEKALAEFLDAAMNGQAGT